MKKRGKIFLSISVCILCLSLLVVGVFASATISFQTTSYLNFVPQNVYAGIIVKTYQGDRSTNTFTELSEEGYSLGELKNFTPLADGFPDMTKGSVNGFISGSDTLTSWSANPIALYLKKPTVRYEITIKNYSPYAIKVTASNSTPSDANIKVDFVDQTSDSPITNSPITINAPTGTTPTKVVLNVDFTVTSNNAPVDLDVALGFKIEKA